MSSIESPCAAARMREYPVNSGQSMSCTRPVRQRDAIGILPENQPGARRSTAGEPIGRHGRAARGPHEFERDEDIVVVRPAVIAILILATQAADDG